MLYIDCLRMSTGLALLSLLLLALTGCGGDEQAKKAAHIQKGEAFSLPRNIPKLLLSSKTPCNLTPKMPERITSLAWLCSRRVSCKIYHRRFKPSPEVHNLIPPTWRRRSKLGELHILERRVPTKAQEKAALVPEADANNIEAHIVLGAAYAGQHKLDDAIATFHTVRTLDPKRIQTYLNLAALYEQHNERAKA